MEESSASYSWSQDNIYQDLDWGMGIVAHDPEESLPIAGAALIVGSSGVAKAEVEGLRPHVLFEQGEGSS